MVNRVCPGENIIEEAVQLGREIVGKQTFDRKSLQKMKVDVYRKAVDMLEQAVDKKARL